MAKRSRFAGLTGRRRAQAAQDGPEEEDRPEAEEDEDEQSADNAEASADGDDDDEAEAENSSGGDAVKDAVKADRKRTAEITSHKFAADLPTLAGHLALNTDLSAKAAGKVLSAAAEDLQPGSDDGSTAAKVLERMQNTNPDVGANGDGGSQRAGAGMSDYASRHLETADLS